MPAEQISNIVALWTCWNSRKTLARLGAEHVVVTRRAGNQLSPIPLIPRSGGNEEYIFLADREFPTFLKLTNGTSCVEVDIKIHSALSRRKIVTLSKSTEQNILHCMLDF